MRRLHILFILVALAGAVPTLGAQSAQGQRPPPKAIPTQPFSRPSLGVTMDYPKKDWLVLSVGAGSASVVFVQSRGQATVALEVLRRKPLAREEITDQTAGLEEESWRARRRQARDFSPQFLDINGARSIIMDFSQPGPNGPEHVRMYTMPRGSDWYRVVCTTAQADFDKYKEIFHAMALSLKPESAQ